MEVVRMIGGPHDGGAFYASDLVPPGEPLPAVLAVWHPKARTRADVYRLEAAPDGPVYRFHKTADDASLPPPSL